jgi:DNA polymerase-3 subunit delta'
MTGASSPFNAIEGQKHPLRLLQRSLASNRVAHAYLFEGIEGCGRELTARALFQTIFCARGTGCGSCPPCRRFLAGSHPDLHVVEPDGAFIKIDQIRELQREMALKPFEASRKGVLIRQADRLHPAAANALLKTLEEPAGNALMVLVTANPAAILPTIRSRCQAVPFAPLSADILLRLLTARGNDPDSAAMAASLAGGSMARALEMAADEGECTVQQIASRVAALSLADISSLFSLAEEFSSDRETALMMLERLLAATRDVMLLEHGCPELVAGSPDPHPAAGTSPSSTAVSMRRIEGIMEAMRALRRNANVRLTLDTLFMRLAEGL